MREVSCKVIAPVIREAERRRLPPDAITAGTPYDLAYLRSGRQRIQWSEFIQIMANARRIWSEDELVELGKRIVGSRIMRPITMMARLLFTAKDFYLYINDGRRGVGVQLFSNILQPTFREAGGNCLEVDLITADGYPPCREFYLLTKGAFTVVPVVLGLPPSVVTMTEVARGVRYRVEYPSGGGWLGRFRRLVSWPFTVRAVARELKDANEVLEARYQELDQARGVLALQAQKLRAANQIGARLHGDLDLGRTLSTAARTLIELGDFVAARIELSQPALGDSEAGPIPSDREPLEAVLAGRQNNVVRLQVWPKEGSDQAERRDLLDFVAPTVAMALDNAIAYHALADYRENLERKVEERTAELADTVARLQEAKAARDRIFANINHEIRTPLTLIQLAAGQLESLVPEGDAQRTLAGIGQSVRKLLRLVDEMLLLAAGQEHKLVVRRAPTDLAALCRQVLDLWAPAAAAAGLRLSFALPERACLDVDATLIERAITNLVSNAVKFTPPGGSVHVGLTEEAHALVLEVRDTGIGIDEDLKRRLFGRFEQGRAAMSTRASGSGIGLSLVREVVSAHGGTIELDSPRSGGSVFRMTLPSEAPASSKGANGLNGFHRPAPQLGPVDFGLHGEAPAPEADLQPNGAARATLLLAEDDAQLAQAIARLLADEYRVVVAPDGLSALQLAERHRPDLLISDVGMPGMDGLELTRRFRDLPGNRLSPVLLLSAFADVGDRLAGFDAGAVDYVVKPFEATELKARVRSQLALRALALKLHQTEKLASLGTLSAGLAHEMRNPANAIVNAVEPLRELLPSQLLSPEQPVAQLLDVLQEGSRHIGILSRQLLGFRRAGQLEREQILVGDLLGRALSLVGPLYRDRELRERHGYRGQVECAGPLVVQLLVNLLENAAQAAGPGGWVSLHTSADEERLAIDVGDSGPGVPPELRERIFEPFFSTKPPGTGTGLGLTTARDIAHRHDGALEVRSAPGGTIFHLELPLRRAP